MSRWHDSVLRTRMPAWYFNIGAWYHHQHTKRLLRKLAKMHEDHPDLR